MMMILLFWMLERLLSRPVKLDQEEVGSSAEDCPEMTGEEGNEPPVTVGSEHLAPPASHH